MPFFLLQFFWIFKILCFDFFFRSLSLFLSFLSSNLLLIFLYFLNFLFSNFSFFFLKRTRCIIWKSRKGLIRFQIRQLHFTELMVKHSFSSQKSKKKNRKKNKIKNKNQKLKWKTNTLWNIYFYWATECTVQR